jgi:hypothetical protein
MTSSTISTTIRASGPVAVSFARVLATLSLGILSTASARLRGAWDHLAVSGQLGPDPERSIGRSTGCRI